MNKDYWDKRAVQFKDSLLKQVGKTVNGKDVDENQLLLIIDSIVESLRITPKDAVVDLCCGNGLVTNRVARSVSEIIGVDFSADLIETAKSNISPTEKKIKYIVADVMHLPEELFLKFRKFYMYEALQYFNPVTFSEVLKKMNVMEKGSLFFIASIPDKAHLFEYYDTPEKKKFYYECEERKEPHIGYWWDVDDLKGISEENGFDFTYLNQSPDLYTGYYRFNCLLEKK